MMESEREQLFERIMIQQGVVIIKYITRLPPGIFHTLFSKYYSYNFPSESYYR